MRRGLAPGGNWRGEADRARPEADIGEVIKHGPDVVIRALSQPVHRHAVMNTGVDTVQALIRIVPRRGSGGEGCVGGAHRAYPFFVTKTNADAQLGCYHKQDFFLCHRAWNSGKHDKIHLAV